MSFNSNAFLLMSNTAKTYYDILKEQPIFDYHCHLDSKEIYEDKVFEDIVALWLGGDHYKWRLMRANGIPEAKITGNASAKEKFEAWALTLSQAFGSPLYHWSHLEMKQIFGIDEYVTPSNWESLYERMNTYILEHQLSPKKLIKRANVKFIGTTDHPLDSLDWHRKIKEDDTFDTVVAPTFRPDEAFVNHVNFKAFTEHLSEMSGLSIKSFEDFINAMETRIAYFAEVGCKASDHSFTRLYFALSDEETLNQIFEKAMLHEELTEKEIQVWQTAVFNKLCGLYKKYHFVTQVHFGALRNQNQKYLEVLGADSGFDSMTDQNDLAVALNGILNHLVLTEQLPKMIFYNLNPTYNTLLANTVANFQANEEGIRGQVQFGAAWWFGDTERGMVSQMDALAEQGLLSTFVGMLTDSRSFLSYQRHDYFRRILAAYLANWVDTGRAPDDIDLNKNWLEGIAYRNAKEFFKK
ncbi:MAG: glucuronate isomerase [Streptococcus sp.]|nr:glucuronate isomerase [Streptococcus sp.]